MMSDKDLKKRMKKGEFIIGSWNSITSAKVVEAMGYSGLDFMVIDLEHAPISIESAENLVRAADVTGMASIIRVPGKSPDSILKALDIGACGIQVPHVSSKKEAEIIVEYAKYYPIGKRGLSPFIRAGKYGLDKGDYITKANENNMVIINIEGVEGIKNLSKIASVSDIDVIFIGPYDLSQSLGKPGKIDDPEVIKCIKKCVKIIEEKRLACGSFANNLEYLKMLIDCGVQYITYAVDANVILESYRDIRKSFVSLIANNKEEGR